MFGWMSPRTPRPAALALLVAALGCKGGDDGASASATSATDPTTTSGSTGGSAGSSTSEATASETTAATSTTGGDDPGPLDLPALPTVQDDHFATSPVCAECHSNDPGATAMRDPKDRPIAPFDLWQGSMMANSARDPFWWAMVAGEVATFPAAKGAIEAKCMSCHTPMVGVDAQLHGDPAPAALDWLFKGDERAGFGLDGVACALCHQIQPDGLGADASFSGHFVIAAKKELYGPHATPFTMPMIMHTGFTPKEGAQILDSALCGSCHTLSTSPLAADGTALPHTLLEQAPYLEWRASAYSTEVPEPAAEAQSCQGCHLPTVSEDGEVITTRIARRPHGGDFPAVSPRAPYGRHVMAGGNTLIPQLLRDFAAELRPQASAAVLDAARDASLQLLQGATANLDLEVSRDGDHLVLAAAIQSLVGHKLPSGFPSRRSWVRVEVRDARGGLVFRSGAVDGAGRLVDRTDKVLASEAVGGPTHPHYAEISADDQVQIYEAIMADPEGAPTFRLLRGAAFLKDNRLLPAGWRAADAQALGVAPVGVGGDGDFGPAGDVARYRVLAPAAAGPYKVEVALVHQVLGARFAAELFALDAPAIRRFEEMLGAADRGPVVLAGASASAP